MKLSIITINKNNAAGLEKTCRSVAAQTFGDFEWIVIDGASTDGGVDIIKQYADKITFWVSEPDAGIYNAMNKGIRRAQGEYCLFLNSGDCLIAPETLKNVFDEIDMRAGVYYSNWRKTNGQYIVLPEKLDIKYLIFTVPNHQNTLIKRSLFLEHGFYNESLRISSDHEYFMREMWVYKTSFSHITTEIALYDDKGISSINPLLREAEKHLTWKNVFPELSDFIIELNTYRNSLYANIVTSFGYSKVFHFWLRLYRFFAAKLRKIGVIPKNI